MLTPLFPLEKKLLNKTILSIILYILLANNLIILKRKLKKTASSIKAKKPLIDLPSQRQNLSLKTTHSKTIEKVEQMLFDLQKIKTKQNTTSTSTVHAISRKGKYIVSLGIKF